MEFQSGVGYSNYRDPKKAVSQAIESAQEQCKSAPQLVMVFCGSGYDYHAILSAVSNAFPNTKVVGSSAEGVISNGISIEGAYCLEVALFASDSVQFDVVSATGLKQNSEHVGAELGRALQLASADKKPVGVMLLSDGLSTNYDSLTQGLSSQWTPEQFVPVFGGLSSENWQFEETNQFVDGQVLTDSAVAILLSGDAELVFEVNHGCVPIGQEMVVTRSEANTIYEIDGRPALDVMQEFFEIDSDDSWNKATNNLTIALKASDSAKELDEHVVRYMPSRNLDDRSFCIATDIESGTSIWLARRDYNKMEQGLESLSSRLVSKIGNRHINTVFQFDCAGRGTAIFQEQEKLQLLDRLHTQVAPNVPWIGFHCLGEFGPVGQTNHFHNYTVVVAALVSND